MSGPLTALLFGLGVVVVMLVVFLTIHDEECCDAEREEGRPTWRDHKRSGVDRFQAPKYPGRESSHYVWCQTCYRSRVAFDPIEEEQICPICKHQRVEAA